MDEFLAVKTSLRSGSGGHGLKQPSITEKQHTHNTNGLDTVHQLGNVLHDSLHVKDENSETSSESPPDDDGSSGSKDGNTCNHAVVIKCLQKCASFPVPTTSEGTEPESQLEDSKGYTRSLSMPTARKVVSAMKGGREKHGIPQKSLSVSWAPDVYDPPPTSVSHFPRKKNQQQYSKSQKKHGKAKQKGKNSRGGGSVPKEKKHHRKSSGKTERCSNSYMESNKMHDYKSSMEMLDFNSPGINNPARDPNCGSKFLGQASGTMQGVY